MSSPFPRINEGGNTYVVDGLPAIQNQTGQTSIPVWQANTAYPAPWLVVAPTGEIVNHIAAGTDGATYNAANWTVVNGSGTGGAVDLSGYATTSQLGTIVLPDTTSASATPQATIGQTLNVTSPGAVVSAPALPSTVGSGAALARWAVKAPASGAVAVTYPNSAGTTETIPVLASESITFRQKSTSGWGSEDHTPLTQLDLRYPAIVHAGRHAPSGADSLHPYYESRHGILNIKDPEFGAKVDGQVVYDGAMASGTPAITSASAPFSALVDVGRVIVIADATSPSTTGTTFKSTITAVSGDGKTATVADTPSVSITSGSVTWATEDGPAWTAAVAAAKPGQSVYQPFGISISSALLQFPDAVGLLGDGDDYGPSTASQRGGSVLFCGAYDTVNSFTTFGTTLVQSPILNGQTHPVVSRITIDASNRAAYAVTMVNSRSRFWQASCYRGRTATLYLTAQNAQVGFSTIGAAGMGDTIRAYATDIKITNCDVRQSGVNQIAGQNAGNLLVSACHMYSGASGSLSNSAGGANVKLYWAGSSNGTAATIVSNTFDGTNGPHVLVSFGGNITLGPVLIASNTAFQVTAFTTDNTYPFVKVAGAYPTAYFDGLKVSSNAVIGTVAADLSAIVDTSAFTGTMRLYSVVDNVGKWVRTVYLGARPDILEANMVSARPGGGGTNTIGTTLKDHNDGSATLAGTGSATTFTIPHGLAGAPRNISVDRGNAAAATAMAAAGGYYLTADATNITITFVTAPANGTSLQVFWRGNQ